MAGDDDADDLAGVARRKQWCWWCWISIADVDDVDIDDVDDTDVDDVDVDDLAGVARRKQWWARKVVGSISRGLDWAPDEDDDNNLKFWGQLQLKVADDSCML